MRKIGSILLALCVSVVTLSSLSFSAAGETAGAAAVSDPSGYAAYLQEHGGLSYNGDTITADLEQATGDTVKKEHNVYGCKDLVVTTGEDGYVDFPITVADGGLYTIYIEYYTVPGSGENIQRDILIDGAVPFSEAQGVSFSRVWKDDGPVTQDGGGNDIRPQQVEEAVWRGAYVADYFGYYGEALYFALEAGPHLIRFSSIREPMAVKSLTLKSANIAPAPYKETLRNWQADGLRPVEGLIEGGYTVTEAEKSLNKSDPTLFPKNDRSSVATQPFDYHSLKLNTIGGSTWQDPGQWICWEITAPKEGLYTIALRSRQNVTRGRVVRRTLYINGEIPFAEAQDLRFAYSDAWRLETLRDREGEPYLCRLREGKNTLTLKVTLGDLEEELGRAERSLKALNNAYFQLLTILGTQPDPYRDYKIATYQPEIIQTFQEQRAELTAIAQTIDDKSEQSSETAVLRELARQLGQMAESPDKIVSVYSSFKDNISALGDWITSARSQPLQLDYIALCEQGAALPKAEKGFFANLKYQIILFFSSFMDQYNMFGAEENGLDKSITVWTGNGVTSGRDQAQILRQLITNSFTPSHGINVNLQLISSGALLPAVLSGKGPDVSLQIESNVAVDYAMRDAVMDLSQLPGYGEMAERFHTSAFEPFAFTAHGRTGVFALPETESFPMLFYRSDILGDLGIDPANLKTWDDIVKIMPVLQKNNLQFGIPSTITSYGSMLYQNGGAFYREGGRLSDLDSKTALETFRSWTEYYVNYGVPLTYSFESRFKMGEMPIGISDYASYNQLSIFAPEIRGQWGMTVIPGVYGEDGELDHTAVATVLGAVIMTSASDKDSSWEFLKWWTSADTQARFGRELESVVGTAARYNTANREALMRLPWSSADRAALNKQLDAARGIPQVPGGYQTQRYLDFALRDVFNNNVEPRTTLLDNVGPINEEIAIVRKELQLD